MAQTVQANLQDVEERMLDKYKRTAHRHIQWLADSGLKNGGEINETTGELACRNTRQGKVTVTDDRGIIFWEFSFVGMYFWVFTFPAASHFVAPYAAKLAQLMMCDACQMWLRMCHMM
ncbi:unnamed protein product [Toxocara canis]|uniref:SCP domain-containing protein n=1 Tax=Toxocara canis TaxID=6265 RepID=A0A183UPY6_TOXCA|nr:unnamed protein product [Toxocara canis]